MRRDDTRGFTLIEILVVVLIIGLLTTVITTNLIGRAEKAKRQLAHTQIKSISDQLELYRLDNGRYPQELQALVSAPADTPRNYPPGGYVKADALVDPWGNPFEYAVPGQHNTHSFDLYSLGPDAAEGGEGDDADVANWSESEGV
jgi:general secretion pathway protein G